VQERKQAGLLTIGGGLQHLIDVQVARKKGRKEAGLRTISGGFVGAGVRNGSATSAAGATRSSLSQVRSLGALDGHVLRSGDLQNRWPWSGIGDAAKGRLVVVGVLQSAAFRTWAAGNVGYALAPTLVGAAEDAIHHGLDDHQD